MGVPGYFAWLNRRYSWVIRKVKQNGNKKHVDCLYIDVNGICYGYARDEANFAYLLNPKALEEIFKQIINHIESIIDVVNPQLQIYFMLDGPCPRAKINQQRQRRFRAQMSDQSLQNTLKSHGLDVKEPTVANNSISPGTPFMFELNQQIRAYFAAKVANAPEECPANSVNYRKVSFVISDSNCQGEGEHKILEVIRKHQNYELTHCIVGADADLILLSMATIGKRILILRENARFRSEKDDLEVQIQKIKLSALEKEAPKEEIGVDAPENPAGKVSQTPKKEYEIIDVNGLKRVLLDRYKKLFESKTVQNLKFNPMSIMDDIVFLSLFVGNDFLPRQNYMQIVNVKNQEHILDTFLDKYEEYLVDATTYLSHRGKINYGAILQFFKVIATIEPAFSISNVFGEKKENLIRNASDYVRLLNSGLSEEALNELIMRDDNSGIVDRFSGKDFVEESKEEETDPFPEEAEESKADSEKPAQLEGKPHNNHRKQFEKKEQKDKTTERANEHGEHCGNEKKEHKEENELKEQCEVKETKGNSGGHHDQSEKKEHHGDKKWNGHGDRRYHGEKGEHGSSEHSSTHERPPKREPKPDPDPELTKMMADHVNGKVIYLRDRLKVKSQDEYDYVIMKYLEGFQFTLMYYFRGIESASWNYYYPQYYAPLAQDIVEFLERNPNFEVKFMQTRPFQPYKQLLAILPPQSAGLLPTEFRGLFETHLKAFCPDIIEIDAYGATAEHMQIVKLPFIDLETLEKAYNEGEERLLEKGSDYDQNRNQKSMDVMIFYSKDHVNKIESRNKLLVPEDIENAHVGFLSFNHLDAVLPLEVTTLKVDKEKKDEARKRYLATQEAMKAKKKAKKISNAADVVAKENADETKIENKPTAEDVVSDSLLPQVSKEAPKEEI